MQSYENTNFPILKFQIDMKLKLKLKIISQSYKQNVAETYKYPQTFRLSYLV